MNKAGHTKERPGLMVSDFDFIRIHAAARKSKQGHGCFPGNLPYLPRPRQALFRAGDATARSMDSVDRSDGWASLSQWMYMGTTGELSLTA